VCTTKFRGKASARNRARLGGVYLLTLKPRLWLILLLSLAVAGTSVLAWRQWAELVTLRAITLGGDERVAWQVRLDELKKRNYQLQAELAAIRRTAGGDVDAAERLATEAKDATGAGGVKTADAVLLAASAAAQSKKDDDLELLAALANLPEFQKLLALQQGGKIDEKYAALFKKLHLSPEELARMQTLLGEKQSAIADVALAVRDQGLTGQAASDVARQLLKQSQLDLNNSIKNLLGPQRYGQYQNYENTAPQRQTVDQLAQRLSYTSTPLTAKQSDQLVQALAAKPRVDPANPSASQPLASIRPLPASMTNLGIASANLTPIPASAVAAAQTFLSAPQLTALQRMQQEQQAQQILGNLIRTGNTSAPPKPAPAVPTMPKPKG